MIGYDDESEQMPARPGHRLRRTSRRLIVVTVAIAALVLLAGVVAFAWPTGQGAAGSALRDG